MLLGAGQTGFWGQWGRANSTVPIRFLSLNIRKLISALLESVRSLAGYAAMLDVVLFRSEALVFGVGLRPARSAGHGRQLVADRLAAFLSTSRASGREY